MKDQDYLNLLACFGGYKAESACAVFESSEAAHKFEKYCEKHDYATSSYQIDGEDGKPLTKVVYWAKNNDGKTIQEYVSTLQYEYDKFRNLKRKTFNYLLNNATIAYFDKRYDSLYLEFIELLKFNEYRIFIYDKPMFNEIEIVWIKDKDEDESQD